MLLTDFKTFIWLYFWTVYTHFQFQVKWTFSFLEWKDSRHKHISDICENGRILGVTSWQGIGSILNPSVHITLILYCMVPGCKDLFFFISSSALLPTKRRTFLMRESRSFSSLVGKWWDLGSTSALGTWEGCTVLWSPLFWVGAVVNCIHLKYSVIKHTEIGFF